MDDRGILNLINSTEAELWSAYAQHHEFEGHCLVYDVQSPTQFWSNSIYTNEVAHRFELHQAQMLETFYQIHGLEGFLRDFHGDFTQKSIATYTYLYFDPAVSTALASPSALSMHRCGSGELGAFSETARLCYNRGPDFAPAFRERMGRVIKRWPVIFLQFNLHGQPAGVLSLVQMGKISRLMHLAVHPDLRKRGYGTEILQAAMRTTNVPVFAATEIPQLYERTFPAAAFRTIAQFQAIPLLSLLR